MARITTSTSPSHSINLADIAGLYTHAKALEGISPYERSGVAYSQDADIAEAERHVVKCYNRGDMFDANTVAPLLGITKDDTVGNANLVGAIEAYYHTLENDPLRS